MLSTLVKTKTNQEIVFIMSQILVKKVSVDRKEYDNYSLFFEDTTDCRVTKQLTVIDVILAILRKL